MSYGSLGEQCREHHGGSGNGWNIDIKNANKDSRARMSTSVEEQSSGTKKKLNYNYKEVSNQLLRAKKPQGAANALTKAKSRLATLQRYAATGEYDSKEISAAVAHARRMVECAQLKSASFETGRDRK